MTVDECIRLALEYGSSCAKRETELFQVEDQLRTAIEALRVEARREAIQDCMDVCDHYGFGTIPDKLIAILNDPTP